MGSLISSESPEHSQKLCVYTRLCVREEERRLGQRGREAGEAERQDQSGPWKVTCPHYSILLQNAGRAAQGGRLIEKQQQDGL